MGSCVFLERIFLPVSDRLEKDSAGALSCRSGCPAVRCRDIVACFLPNTLICCVKVGDKKAGITYTTTKRFPVQVSLADLFRRVVVESETVDEDVL